MLIITCHPSQTRAFRLDVLINTWWFCLQGAAAVGKVSVRGSGGDNFQVKVHSHYAFAFFFDLAVPFLCQYNAKQCFTPTHSVKAAYFVNEIHVFKHNFSS